MKANLPLGTVVEIKSKFGIFRATIDGYDIFRTKYQIKRHIPFGKKIIISTSSEWIFPSEVISIVK